MAFMYVPHQTVFILVAVLFFLAVFFICYHVPRPKNTDYEYEVAVPATVDTGSRVSGVTWYEVHTMRKADSKGTLVSIEYKAFDCSSPGWLSENFLRLLR